LQNIYCQTHHTNMYKPPRYYMPGSANSPQNFNAYSLKIISLFIYFFLILINHTFNLFIHSSPFALSISGYKDIVFSIEFHNIHIHNKNTFIRPGNAPP